MDDRSPERVRVERSPDAVQENITKLALDELTLSPHELTVRFTDTENYCVSEASVYRMLKGHDLADEIW